MSGTSMDGINATLVKTDGVDLFRYNFSSIYSYSSETIRELNVAIKDPTSYLNRTNKLEQMVTYDHYLGVQKLLDKSKIKPDIIGFHGQTIYHSPKQKISLQIGDPYLLSKLLKVSVVSDFRSNDIENGGEGAPIAPIYHSLIMKQLKLKLPACILNIGGVGNLTYWDGNKLIGFDIGPGNGLMDNYMQLVLNCPYDESGKLASNGIVDMEIVDNFLSNKYFQDPYPKSLDKNFFNNTLERVLSKKLSHQDSLATLLECTVEAVKFSLKVLPSHPSVMVIMGGGIYNHFLIKKLSLIKGLNVRVSTDFDLPGDMIEAELIAYLSARFVNDLPITFPETTGVNSPIKGGRIYTYKNPSEFML